MPIIVDRKAKTALTRDPHMLLSGRLRDAEISPSRQLKLLSDTAERVLVELAGKVYLIFIPLTGAALTPGEISRRVLAWPLLRRRAISGHLLLAPKADLSPSARSADGRGLPPRVAVVGKWGTLNRLVLSTIDPGMEYLLNLAGVPVPATRRLENEHLPVAPAEHDGAVSPNARAPFAPAAARSTLRKGMRLDAYELDRLLGRGYSTEVWKARLIDEINGVGLAPQTAVAIK